MKKDPVTPKYRAPALDKGLDILELLSRTTIPMSINDISEGVGRSRGEIFRMLQVLEERGYLARSNNDSGYILTNRLFRLGMEQPVIKGVIEAAFPIMHRLADRIEQPCHLVVPSHEQIVVIARVDSPTEIGLVVRVGHRRPMTQSASGHVLFAYQASDIQQRWLDIMSKEEPIFDYKKFVKRTQQVRNKGYASMHSHLVDSITDISAPILQHGYAVCALTVPFLQRHGATLTIEQALEHLQQAALDISALI